MIFEFPSPVQEHCFPTRPKPLRPCLPYSPNPSGYSRLSPELSGPMNGLHLTVNVRNRYCHLFDKCGVILNAIAKRGGAKTHLMHLSPLAGTLKRTWTRIHGFCVCSLCVAAEHQLAFPSDQVQQLTSGFATTFGQGPCNPRNLLRTNFARVADWGAMHGVDDVMAFERA